MIADAFLEQGLAGVLPPALISATALVLAWRPWERRDSVEPSRATAWGPPVAIGLGYAAGDVAIHRSWPPPTLAPAGLDVKQTLFYVALAAVLAGAALALRLRGRWIVVAALALATPWWLLDFVRASRWEGAEGLFWSLGLGTAIGAGCAGSEALARRLPGPALPLSWMAVCVLAAGSLELSGSASLAQLASALAPPLAVCSVIAFRQRAFVLSGGGGVVVTVILGGVLLGGRFAAELPVASGVFVFLALQGPWLATVGPARGWKRVLAAVAVATLPALAGVWIALQAAPPPSPYG